MRRTTAVAWSAALLLAATGCSTPLTKRDSWMTNDSRNDDSSWTSLSPTRFQSVLPSKRAAAAQRLEHSQWLRLSPDEAGDLTGSLPRESTTPYLLRALCLGCGTGHFTVYTRG